MAGREVKVHVEAHAEHGAPLSQSLCGQLAVPTTDDLARATCKVCLRRAARGHGAAHARYSPHDFVSPAELAAELHVALGAFADHQRTRAPAPPLMTAELVAEMRRNACTNESRCHQCGICIWEKAAEPLWCVRGTYERSYEPPVNEQGRTARWVSADAALRSLALYYEDDKSRLRSCRAPRRVVIHRPRGPAHGHRWIA